MAKSGKVILVGAGPGDPDLITVKGLAAIEIADCIVYDYLASPKLLRSARPDAELIYAGKRGGSVNMSQDEINALLVEKAREGKLVVRLKGGDPYVFGRGGEEVSALHDAGIEFEVIPGIPMYYATAMPFRGVLLNLLVESHEGRPTKVEGNPDHPVSLGASGIFEQASILNLYDPDRSKAIHNNRAQSDWNAFLAYCQGLLQNASSRQIAVLSEPTSSPTLMALRGQLAAAYPQLSPRSLPGVDRADRTRPRSGGGRLSVRGSVAEVNLESDGPCSAFASGSRSADGRREACPAARPGGDRCGGGRVRHLSHRLAHRRGRPCAAQAASCAGPSDRW